MTVKQTVEITNKLGMHARPAMKLLQAEVHQVRP